jgi:VWFA-related protein
MMLTSDHFSRCLLLAGLLLVPLAAQEPSLVLRLTTRLVQVNVVVQDRGGRPVGDLKKEDFVLNDNGKTQEIRMFSVESKDQVYGPAAPLPLNVFSNRLEQRSGAPANVTAILLDGLNTKWGDQAVARRQIIAYLERIQPQDRVGLYTLGRELRVLHDYTTDAALLLKSLARYRNLYTPVLDAAEPRPGSPMSKVDIPKNPQDPGSIAEEVAQGIVDLLKDEADFYQEQRILKSLKAVEVLANHLAGVPGRKSLVWVSGGFPMIMGLLDSARPAAGWPTTHTFDPLPRQSRGSSEEIAHARRVTGRGFRTFTPEVDRTVRALNNANLAVYPVDARGLLISPTAYVNVTTMKEFAQRTGGKAYYNTNDLMNSVREAVEDSRVTYTLGYYPSDLKEDGNFRDIRVRVNRPRLVVRHRRGYLDAPVQLESAETVLRDAVWSPVDATAVRLDARLDFSAPPAPDGLLVHILVDPASVTFDQQGSVWLGAVDVLCAQTDELGREYEVVSESIGWKMKSEDYQNRLKTGLTYRKTVPRQAGATKFRIVVRDRASGNTGSLTIPLSKIVNDSIGPAPPRPPARTQ